MTAPCLNFYCVYIVDCFFVPHRFDEIHEVNACEAPDRCEIIDPIEFATHGEDSAAVGERFFQKAKDMLKSSLTRAG